MSTNSGLLSYNSSGQAAPPSLASHGQPSTSSAATLQGAASAIPPEILPRPPSISGGTAPGGYPSLSDQMSVFPELAVFRRFGALNAQILLYLQAEIQGMEEKLQKIQIRNSTGNNEQRWSLVDWFFLRHSKDMGEEWELIEDIQKKLNKYNKALVQQYHILRMAPPGHRDLKCLQDFIDRLMLTGKDSSIWGSAGERETGARDLVALLSRPDEDPVSTWVSEKAVDQLARIPCLQSRELNNVLGREGFSEDTLRRLTGIITNVVASALPILSIAVLYSVKPLESRLGIIAAFNFLLSVCLTAFTQARRAEVFAVSAAFSAIQVVFVQVDSKGG